LPALRPESAALLKYFFVPSEHPRWPKGDPEHHGGEFRPVAGDEDDAVPMPGRPRRRRDEEVEPTQILPDWIPPGLLDAASAAPDAPAPDPNAAPDPDSADAQEASLPQDEKEQRREARGLLNSFVADNPDLFRQDPDEARRQFEAENDIPDSIRRLPEYQSFWQMPTSYEAARVSHGYQELPDMQAFKAEFGNAPPGWQYHHIVNQNPTNQQNPNVNWRLHTTENVVPLPTWWHWVVSAVYSSNTDQGILVRDWQAGKSYKEQLDWGIHEIWKDR
jgi:hypothetical protein